MPAATSSVHSKALSFMSSLKSGVDPRTGLYNVSIDLPELKCNDLRGPDIKPTLSYSPLNTLDSGYGYGWTLELSHYDISRHILSLSTGETYRIDNTDGAELLATEKKLDTFHFYRIDQRNFRVAHKSGLTELLTVHSAGDLQVALVTRIIAPSGHSVHLSYSPAGNSQFRLKEITDDAGERLLAVSRSDNMVSIDLYPDSGTDGQLTDYKLILGYSDNRVKRIVLPTDNEASWEFEHDYRHEQLCIVSVRTPTGGREFLSYHDAGHTFPASAHRTALPRVTHHRTEPGFGQSAVDVEYTYSDKNFLGAGLTIAWENDGLDNLFKTLQDYDYVCTESLCIDDKPARTVQRTFNRFHLQTLEVTSQNNHTQTLRTNYNIRPGQPFEQQPIDCQMPRDITTEWTVSGESAIRKETVTHTYYPDGNLQSKARADGVVEHLTWYPAQGERSPDGSELCPANPEGFVSQLKEKTITPAKSSQGGAPTLSTRYTYTALPALEGSDMPEWIVPVTETMVHLDADGNGNELELQRTRKEYFHALEEPFSHGRTRRQTQTLNKKSTSITYDYEKITSEQTGLQALQTKQCLSNDFDEATKTSLRQQSLQTALEQMSLADGVEIHYKYDVLGRVILETTAPGMPLFEASRSYQYTLCAGPEDQAEQVMTDALGVKTCTRVDGMGRIIFEARDNLDSNTPQAPKQIYSACYDAWSNMLTETVYDHRDNDQPLVLTNRYLYDDWNQQRCVIGSDGVQTHQLFDPVGSAESVSPILRSWVQSAEPEPLITGRQETWLNLFGKPDRIISQNGDGETASTQTFLYDGLGRCTKQIDQLQQETLYRYDAWSRMITTTLPDTSVVERSYAVHSSAELPEKIEVIHADGTTRTLAGEQVFDGLQRLTQTRIGNRIETFTYEDGRSQIKARTTGKTDTIQFTYNPTLTHQALTSTAPDERARFEYHDKSARLLLAENEQGKRTYHYDALGRLQREAWTDKQGNDWTTFHESSSKGRPIKRSEQIPGTTLSIETKYDYDTLGRIATLEQGNLVAEFGYDELGRVQLILTTDINASTVLSTALEYDDQGRETLRTQCFPEQPARYIRQEWQADNLLKSRHLHLNDGTSLLLEKFRYDARGRLDDYRCSGATLPKDVMGREITKQQFSFDALDNITLSKAEFADGKLELAMFSYDTDNPCQLTGIVYMPARATPNPSFTYDLNGNQLNDERGQKLVYDSQNRLVGVHGSEGEPVSAYAYDGHDHLVTSRHGSASETLHFYQGHQESSHVQDGHRTQHLYLDEQPLGQQTTEDPQKTLLLLTDANRSVLGEYQQDTLRTAVYSAYGEQPPDQPLLALHGFNGESREPSNGWYLLGNGYRAYNPALMRFHSPDFMSPFSEAGVNPYAYCLGNPIALRDPTGHDAANQSGRLRRPDENVVPGSSAGGGFGVVDWVMLGVGVVFTIAGAYATVASFGATAPVTVPVSVMGISMSAASASTIATGILAVGTVMQAASTAASAYGAATNNNTWRAAGMYAGLASIPLSFGGGAIASTVKSTVKAALGPAAAAQTAARSSLSSSVAAIAASESNAGSLGAASRTSNGLRSALDDFTTLPRAALKPQFMAINVDMSASRLHTLPIKVSGSNPGVSGARTAASANRAAQPVLNNVPAMAVTGQNIQPTFVIAEQFPANGKLNYGIRMIGYN
ncbi:RHS repeat-associated core domain-containing protein [Pseudomonas viridiflava]|uniref:RHS repeat domain-containing protein n=2 Tax=Pseudomonas viridiflava TaxID=33069 RepID=UPI0018E63B51|nr:RHS repeat-associated core domain-containing protein [Pseudomonas viridiflava]MBI6704755.1 RHS repeat-associated core domain-containing protein [Pseudomonas viridiflava]MBI6723441.1 RHS repeat-associated core domain-containing protein [Pseudomonas viridiflava]